MKVSRGEWATVNVPTDFDPNTGSARVRRAWKIMQEKYAGRFHWTGVPLQEHVDGVMKTLLPFQPDDDAIIACLLHHVLQDRMWTISALEENFGTSVRSIVNGVHLLSHVTMKNRRISIGNLRSMLLRVSDDIRVVLIILCDRAYVLEHLDRLSEAERRRVCGDVLHLFAPVAARLGIYTLKHTLESRAFPVVYPTDAERIAEQLCALKSSKGSFLDGAARALNLFLKGEGVGSEVAGREKHPYSIFMKMRSKSVSHIEDIYDLFALRVVVETEEECYRVLGLLHRRGHPVPHRFKDYIAFPKPNGYRSLHTTLTKLAGVPENAFTEVQIRTRNMDREAKFGVAAHWSYKERGSLKKAVQRSHLQKMLEQQESVENQEDETLIDHIFVLTPRGDIVELPEGSTALDFAFHVHTEVGLASRGARVNGSIVPLDHVLENGDIVEVFKGKDPAASPRWLSLLHTASARAKLRRYLFIHKRPEFIMRGREILNAELEKSQLPLLDSALSLLRSYEGRTLTFVEREDLLMKIGQGTIRISSVLTSLGFLNEEKSIASSVTRRRHISLQNPLIHIVDNVPMPLSYAKCCKPHEGKVEAIIGVVTRSGDIKVHRNRCRMLAHVNRERTVKVRWREREKGENTV